jgi:hypothetical protein
VNVAEDLLYLFRGNPDVVGLDDAGHGTPGPLRLDPMTRDSQWQVLMEGHLAGAGGIGTYPYNHEQEGVAWGCVDFDDGEVASWSHALDLRWALKDLGITAFIERSRSKGYHVWVFFGGWVPMPWVRRLLVGCCQSVDAPHREVNPKSNKLEPGQLGNFVRLPYKGTGKLLAPPPRDAKQVVVDELGQPFSSGLFTTLALEMTVSLHQLVRAAKTVHVLPEPPEKPLVDRYGPSNWKDRLNPLAQMELAHGPKPGQDRSSYLAGFAHACRESGLTDADAGQALRLADYLHGRKYTNRKDAEVRYADLVARAYRKEGA